MDDTTFHGIKARLDQDLSARPKTGIKMGSSLYAAFLQRGFLKPKKADLLLWSWMLASYQDRYVFHDFDTVDDSYQVTDV